MEEPKFRSDGLKWLYDKYIKNDPESVQLLKEYEVRAEIAKQIYDLRNQARLTSAQLADIAEVGESVIESLEQADYEGDSLAMLVRIASAQQETGDSLRARSFCRVHRTHPVIR